MYFSFTFSRSLVFSIAGLRASLPAWRLFPHSSSAPQTVAAHSSDGRAAATIAPATAGCRECEHHTQDAESAGEAH